ncbi:MAG: S8 family serine peptidase [Emcibacter sp.]|nr:S8 family serine peptidase [Emcibacter sp.]
MNMMPPRLGLVDSGLSEGQERYVVAGRAFFANTTEPMMPDTLGHGTAVCDVILHYAPKLALYNAQVFDGRGVTTAASVAAALDWLVQEKVSMINLSLGLREDREILKEACAKAVAAGIILIAASPAQGKATYPSAYPGVIRATGDARCAVGEISFLDSAQADFGGCARLDQARHTGRSNIGGSSIGTAHVCGQIVAYLQAGGSISSVREWLVSRADYLHNERRTE